MRFSLAILLLLVLAQSAFAGRLADLNYDPLRAPASARHLGMGEAVLHDDFSPSNMWITPTGVATVGATEFLWGSTDRFTASVSYPLGRERAFGVGFSTHTLTGVRIGTQEVGTRHQVANIAYRFPVENWLGRPKWVGGVGIRIPFATHLSISGEVDRSADFNPSLDVGLRSMTSTDSEFTLGLSGIFGQLPWRTGERDSVPLRSFLGLHTKYGNFTVVLRSFGGTTMHWGGAYPLQNNTELRAGVDQGGGGNNLQTFLTAGVGWQLLGLRLDAALTQTGEPGGYRLFVSAHLTPEGPERDVAPQQAPTTSTPRMEDVKVFSPEELLRVLRIDEPLDSIETSAETIVVRGTVHPNFKLFVNDLEASVGRDGTFALQIPLNIGNNTVRIEARHDTQKSEVVRGITRKSRLLLAEELVLREKFNALPESAREEGEEITWKLRELRKTLDASYRASASGTRDTSGRKYLTRRELAVWLARTKQLPNPALTVESLPDVHIDDPALGAILSVLDAHWMALDQNSNFQPDAPISPEDLIRIVRNENG